MIVRCTTQLNRETFANTEPGCGQVYDDAECWTICPHNPLYRGVEEQVCKRHDLFDCPYHKGEV